MKIKKIVIVLSSLLCTETIFAARYLGYLDFTDQSPVFIPNKVYRMPKLEVSEKTRKMVEEYRGHYLYVEVDGEKRAQYFDIISVAPVVLNPLKD